MTLETILDAVRHEKLFGCIECNIHVPQHSREQFSEMCPIFKNTEISPDDIGKFIKAYAEENDIMSRPRLFATPVLEGYLKHIIEYTPKPCFKPFGDAVSNARRAGDADPSKLIIAHTMKLVGNPPYGKTNTSKEHRPQVKF